VKGQLTIANNSDFKIAKSWTRSSILTPDAAFNAVATASKLSQLGKDLVKQATAALLDEKVITQKNKGRPAPGRAFHRGDALKNALSQNKHIDMSLMEQAVKFKRTLDNHFRGGRGLPLNPMADEGTIMAITNLQAYGRIRMNQSRVPKNKFGLMEGNYKTREMDKAKLRFNIELVPTDSYIYDSENPVLARLQDLANSPPQSPDGAIPVWYDINGDLIPDLWKKILCSFLGLLAMRPGMPVSELVRSFKPALEEWDIKLLLEWCLRVNALTEARADQEAWSPSEWWWLIAGSA
jgi:transcription factor C subunit 3